MLIIVTLGTDTEKKRKNLIVRLVYIINMSLSFFAASRSSDVERKRKSSNVGLGLEKQEKSPLGGAGTERNSYNAYLFFFAFLRNIIS